MLEGNTHEEPASNRAVHELWLAMQAAHQRYKGASVLLDSLATTLSEIDTPASNPEFARVAATQRAAFENYVETRLQLSEVMLSEQSAKQREISVPQRSGGIAVNSRSILLVALVGLIVLLAFEMRALAAARGHNHELERVLTATSAALTQKQDQIADLAEQLETSKASNATLVRSIGRLRRDQARLAQRTTRQFASRGRGPQQLKNRKEAGEHLRADVDQHIRSRRPL